jgi:hypothetical protein
VALLILVLAALTFEDAIVSAAPGLSPVYSAVGLAPAPKAPAVARGGPRS